MGVAEKQSSSTHPHGQAAGLDEIVSDWPYDRHGRGVREQRRQERDSKVEAEDDAKRAHVARDADQTVRDGLRMASGREAKVERERDIYSQRWI